MDFSFLHAADLHLGSPFVGIGKSNPKLQEHLQNAYFKSFRKLVDLAISRTVDLAFYQAIFLMMIILAYKLKRFFEMD